MAEWEIDKNIAFINNRFIDVMTTGSNISNFINDVGYITASVSGSYVPLTTYNAFILSYNTGSFTGSFDGVFTGIFSGSISNAVSSSYALTSSYALNGGPFSFIITGSVTASVHPNDTIFLIKSQSINYFQVSSSGVIILATSSVLLTNPAPYGGMYFTSESLYLGLEP